MKKIDLSRRSVLPGELLLRLQLAGRRRRRLNNVPNETWRQVMEGVYEPPAVRKKPRPGVVAVRNGREYPVAQIASPTLVRRLPTARPAPEIPTAPIALGKYAYQRGAAPAAPAPAPAAPPSSTGSVGSMVPPGLKPSTVGFKKRKRGGAFGGFGGLTGQVGQGIGGSLLYGLAGIPGVWALGSAAGRAVANAGRATGQAARVVAQQIGGKTAQATAQGAATTAEGIAKSVPISPVARALADMVPGGQTVRQAGESVGEAARDVIKRLGFSRPVRYAAHSFADHQAMVRGIGDNRLGQGDDNQRLIYADMLDEENHSALGEMVRRSVNPVQGVDFPGGVWRPGSGSGQYRGAGTTVRHEPTPGHTMLTHIYPRALPNGRPVMELAMGQYQRSPGEGYDDGHFDISKRFHTTDADLVRRVMAEGRPNHEVFQSTHPNVQQYETEGHANTLQHLEAMENYGHPERFAAYKAPSGGIVVRGVYYKGGMTLPSKLWSRRKKKKSKTGLATAQAFALP